MLQYEQMEVLTSTDLLKHFLSPKQFAQLTLDYSRE